MPKKVYYEPGGRLHPFDQEFIRFPPDGYEFVVDPTLWDAAISPMMKSDLIFQALYSKLRKHVPIGLVKSRLEALFKRIPAAADLTFARNHVSFRREPWVVHVEWVHFLAGQDTTHLRRFRRLIEKRLASEYCKGIITWSQAAKKSIVHNLDCTDFAHKLEVIPLAVRKKNFVKRYNDEKVRLLFASTASAKGASGLDLAIGFDAKGGKEVIETFSVLSDMYDNVELVIRSPVPGHMRKRLRMHPNVKIIEQVLPWEALEQEFMSADIFLLPAHHTPFMVMLDAMSYELPVVTTKVFGNAEIVQDGLTGFVVRASEHVPYYFDKYIPAGGSPLGPQYANAIKRVDSGVVKELVARTRTLIDDKELRRRMGKAARWDVEQGKLSIRSRNEKLRKVFDEATQGMADQ
jgi:glycosyltransferase involved in cell wall biosynthesis